MIFLQDNVYLKREIKPEDIKPRLLGTYLVNSLISLLIHIGRSLGNMPRADPGLFPPQLLNNQT